MSWGVWVELPGEEGRWLWSSPGGPKAERFSSREEAAEYATARRCVYPGTKYTVKKLAESEVPS